MSVCCFFLKTLTLITLCVVVDDLAFVSNSAYLLADFTDRISSAFDVKFFGAMKSFIGSEISQTEEDYIGVF